MWKYAKLLILYLNNILIYLLLVLDNLLISFF